MKIADFKIEEWMNKYEASAKYDLTTTCISPLALKDLPYDNSVFNINLDYGYIEGSPRLKNAIASLYQNQAPENITITHGAIGANQLVFLSLLEKDDEVVTIVPAYQQHYSIPESFKCNVKKFFLEEKNNWLPDLSKLDEIITPKTKLLCLTNPNNPTGAVIPDKMLKQISEIAGKNNTWLLSDEVYRGLNLSGNPYSISIADIYTKGISVGSMSKTYSLPGLRVGWIAAGKDLIKEINHQRQYNTISISAIDDYFAAVAIEYRDKIAERNFKILNNGINILTEWLKKNPEIKCIVPAGGTTAFLKYKKNISSRKLCAIIQKNTGVALLPGETMEYEGFIRIGFCAKNLDIALEKISEFLI